MERRNLRLLRVANGLNQEEMAQRLGISRSNYCCIETGRQGVSMKVARKLKEEFAIPSEEMWALIEG